ncbi:hypothetical protein BDF22DRAFT_695152 [Syncephalis plumigaleata]|nr:hypothetical protein BDF22DRAFT_695152 [Syncephalis plumigaleata]
MNTTITTITTMQYLREENVDWRINATRLWGIPLHPTGEMLLYDYVVEMHDDRRETQLRMLSIYFELSVDLMMSTIFVRNLFIALVMIAKRPRVLSGWFCSVPAILGTGWGFGVILYLLDQSSCRPVVWFFVIAMTLSSASNSAIVLQKAYIILMQQKQVLILGLLLIIPQVAFMPIFLMSSWVTTNVNGGCAIHYETFVPFYWFGLTIPINVLFSALFSYIAYKHYKGYGMEAWKELAHDGIQIMCLAVICNIFCATCLVLEVGGKFADMFFVVDWLFTSSILVYHCNSSCKHTAICR